MRITCHHLVIAIAAIAILLVVATGAAMGADQVLNASAAPAAANESSGLGSWTVYLAGGIVIAIMGAGIMFILQERSGK